MNKLYQLLTILILAITVIPVYAVNCIGPVDTPTPAKADAWASVHEPEADEDYIYEDDNIIIWFDFSSGGFPRGVWLKDGDQVLRSKNTNGDVVPTNILFGGGYQLLASSVSRPDSPTENFMIFAEHHPRPGLPGRVYTREFDGYTDIGFIGWLYNTVIKAAPGLDPNTDPLKPEYMVPNIYTNDSWEKDKEYWVHVSTDPATHNMNYEKVRGDGTLRRMSYRIIFRIYHNRNKYDSSVDLFLHNKPNLSTVLLCMDTMQNETVNGSDYVKSLGITGLNTASWDVASYDNWLGIPPEKVIRKNFPKGVTASVRHVEDNNYSGNGATSFVVWKENLRAPWIELSNGNRDASGKVTKGLDVVMRRDWRKIDDCTHFGFTDTPWYDGSTLGYWWVTNEVAINPKDLVKDLEVRSFAETVSFRMNR